MESFRSSDLKGESPLHVFKNFKMNLLIGTLIGLGSYSQFAAYTFAPIAYVIAVKRTSIIFSVLLGRLVFQEAALANARSALCWPLSGWY